MNIVTPVFGLMPQISDSWPCSCSLPSLCPLDTKKPRVLGNHTPTTPHGASGPECQAPGARTGPEGNICMFSVQLLDTGCRIFELRDQTAAGGLPPKPPGPDTSQVSLSTNPLRPTAWLLQGACRQLRGQLRWRAVQENRYSQHIHTLSP